MEINGVTSNTTTQPAKTENKDTKKTENTTNQKSTTETAAAVYEPSKQKVSEEDRAKINKLLEESKKQVEDFKKFILGVFRRQGDSSLKGYENLDPLSSDKQFDMLTRNFVDKLRNGEITVTEEERLQAQKDISEDGYWGVKQTSKRILDMAKALAGNDPQYIPKLKDAFIKGYKSAADVFGGELPSLCKDTYDAVMKGFDEWEKGSAEKTA